MNTTIFFSVANFKICQVILKLDTTALQFFFCLKKIQSDWPQNLFRTLRTVPVLYFVTLRTPKSLTHQGLPNKTEMIAQYLIMVISTLLQFGIMVLPCSL